MNSGHFFLLFIEEISTNLVLQIFKLLPNLIQPLNNYI